jgi:Mn-dependent DtxR family transcriptional regulator
MSELTTEEIGKKILDYLRTKKHIKVRSVFKAIGVEKKRVDQVIAELAKADKVEYIYLDTSYVKIKE